MDRRKSLKYITLGSLASGALLSRCEPKIKKGQEQEYDLVRKNPVRPPEEIERDLKLLKEKFFTDHEMATVTVLANLVIPADEHSGNASDAGVPDFIEFMMKDRPVMQTPMRGGLKWLDLESNDRFNKIFINCTEDEQTSILDDIAYPDTARAEMSQGVYFFSMFRDLVSSGFWTSKIGIADLGYQGNHATVWNGPPREVMNELGVQYDPELMPEYVTPEDRNTPMEYDK